MRPGEGKRIGVYVCHCGTNIAATVNIREVAEFSRSLRSVVIARDYMFMCSDPGQELIRDDIKEYGLNRVVVASCSPLLHERTFRRVCRGAGLNPYLFEMANIREHCSWVHEDGATEKAKELVKAAVMRVYHHQPLEPMEVPINPNTLVVGGGIAGIQAALDIANAGYKVYLVEREPSIGGHMIQLDKTFPTLDCSQCILTPKMSEVGSHPNIELMTYSEVEEVSGYIGNFRVKVKKKARYVDEAKCNGCGLCAEVCPIGMSSEFNQGLGKRKAIYIPFPQAIPNKYVIDKREERPCKAACQEACPIHVNVPGYLALVVEGKFQDAYKLIRRTNPLPAICGRVCHHPCEETCNRGQVDDPVAINRLKRFAADQVDIEKLDIPRITRNGKKVAIIGSGPAGLTAANALALLGYEVTVFEASSQPGGMLRSSIPAFILPQDIVDKEIKAILGLGIELKVNTPVVKVNELFDAGYGAIFIATGAQEGRKLPIPGADLDGVLVGVSFLQAVNRGEKVKLGKKVLVLGGGGVACDVARTARRLGAAEVHIACLESRTAMPAYPWEIEASEKEGVIIHPSRTFTRLVGKAGKVTGVQCLKLKWMKFDEEGGLHLEPIPGSEHTLQADTVIFAVGQGVDTAIVSEVNEIKISRRRTIVADPETLATGYPGVFAGGDVVTGPASVIDAIAAGKKAACSIDKYLKGEPLVSAEIKRVPERLSGEEIASIKKRFVSQRRVRMAELEPGERIKTFLEVEQGYTIKQAVEEARRCLALQIEGCFECGECGKRCDPKAIKHEMRDEYMDIEVGSIILATGYDVFDPSVIPQYGYKKYDNVFTSLEFERMCSPTGPSGGRIQLKNGKPPQSVAIIHCVGSRDKNFHEYCSRVCCMYALKFSYLIKEKTNAEVYQMYIDMRCFGEGYEEFYERVSTKEGIKFIRGKVSRVTDRALTEAEKGKLVVCVENTLLGSFMRVPVDMVILCPALEPRSDADKVAKLFFIGRRADGFFMERHVKLEPITTLTDGVFIAGCCESPKDIPDTVAQAKAAACEVLSLLSRGKVEIEPIIALVDEEVCSGCGLCANMCPYKALSLSEPESIIMVNKALCKGCGACAGVCLSGAISLSHFTYRQILDEVEALSS